MSEARAISTTSRRELASSFFPPARQGAEENSRHSDRNISLFSSKSGYGLISTPVHKGNNSLFKAIYTIMAFAVYVACMGRVLNVEIS
jgi:hypothetical protein